MSFPLKNHLNSLKFANKSQIISHIRQRITKYVLIYTRATFSQLIKYCNVKHQLVKGALIL